MTNNKYSVATFGGGCFWCTEAIFNRVAGVIKVTSGYSGGKEINTTYDAVCSGETGHAEVIQVEYDLEIISYATLLDVFFKTHNPTTLDRQGVDCGTHYRSIILYHNNKQKQIAEDTISYLDNARIWEEPIVTEIVLYNIFYSAEAYHQNYFENNSKQMYCQMAIAPKIAKFEKVFGSNIKK